MELRYVFTAEWIMVVGILSRFERGDEVRSGRRYREFLGVFRCSWVVVVTS